MLSEAEIYEVLSECFDPEIPVNIVDLGLIYAVILDGETVTIRMTLTARGCSMARFDHDLKSRKSVYSACPTVIAPTYRACMGTGMDAAANVPGGT